MNDMNEFCGFVDFHTHILPKMDDGAKDLSESRQMLDMLRIQGVGVVCLTPHFYSYKESLELFLARRKRSFSMISSFQNEMGIRFVLASETFFTDYIFNLEDISELCIKGEREARYLLIEFPFESSFSGRTIDRISRLINTFNVVPVFAHIERYAKLFHNPQLIGELIDLGCLMQTNVSALTHGLFQKKRILKYIDNNMIQVIGTDAHNTSTRPPKYTQGIDTIRKALGENAVRQLMENANQIVSGSIA